MRTTSRNLRGIPGRMNEYTSAETAFQMATTSVPATIDEPMMRTA
jgi:hypothetical protein